MTRKQKQALAVLVMQQVGNIAEFWSEMIRDDIELNSLDYAEAMTCLARWLNHLPGDTWDTRIPWPK